MTSTNIARATALRSAIDAIFKSPNKKTLRQSEALAVLAKIDGARNANVVTTPCAPPPAPESTLVSLWDQAQARMHMQSNIALVAMGALARSGHADHRQTAIAAVLGSLPYEVWNTALWHARRNEADPILASALASLPGEAQAKPTDPSETAFVHDRIGQLCRHEVEAHIEAALQKAHPALANEDMLPSFQFVVLGTDLVPGLDIRGKTPRQVAETVVLPGTWTLRPGNNCQDIDGGYVDAADVARYADKVRSIFGMEIEDFLTMPRTDLTWIDIFLLAQVQYSMGYEGPFFEGTYAVDPETRTFELFFGT